MKTKFDKPIALVDLDGTLIDFEGALNEDYDKMRSVDDLPLNTWDRKNRPPYVEARIDAICARKDWWENLSWRKTGKELIHLFIKYDFRIMVLTQGPKDNPEAWSGKLAWCIKNLPYEVDVTITRDKGIVYGKVLADDYPKYIEAWLAHRPRGKVIMPSHDYNKDFVHPQVSRYEDNIGSFQMIEKLIEGIRKDFKGEQS